MTQHHFSRITRAIFAALSAFFLLLAAWVAHHQVFVGHGRFLEGGQTLNEGQDALAMAALLGCLGMSFFGVFCKKKLTIIWMGLWMASGITIPIIQAYRST